jgi:hypothetical protein
MVVPRIATIVFHASLSFGQCGIKVAEATFDQSSTTRNAQATYAKSASASHLSHLAIF